MVQMLSCLGRSLNAAPLRDDDVAVTATVGGSGSVLSSCATSVCMLYARVCCMSLAAEMSPQRLPAQQSLPQLLERVRGTLSNAAQVTCFSVALACGGGAVYRGIAASVHRALHAAQLPAYICELCVAARIPLLHS